MQYGSCGHCGGGALLPSMARRSAQVVAGVGWHGCCADLCSLSVLRAFYFFAVTIQELDTRGLVADGLATGAVLPAFVRSSWGTRIHTRTFATGFFVAAR